MKDTKLKDHTSYTGVHVYASSIKKYCWVRIPKCGSSTLTSILENNCKWDYHEYDAPHANWENHFKFAFVRNPWDRIYSCFKSKVSVKGGNCSDYLNHFQQDIEFKSWLKIITHDDNILKDRHFTPMQNLMINKSFDSMDFIGQIENFYNDIKFVCSKLDIKCGKIPHENKTKHRHYTKYYDDETCSIIAEKYAKDIEYFDYSFGD